MSEAPEEANDDLAAPMTSAVCWRCELEVSVELPVCPHCEAQLLNSENGSAADIRARQAADPFKVMMWSYALLLSTTILLAFSLAASFGEADVLEEPVRTQVLTQLLFLEVVDTVIVFVAFAIGYRAIRSRLPKAEKPLQAWLVFVPMLAFFLLLNYQYHWLLREVLQLPILEDDLTARLDWLVFIIYCIQPAIVEEAYCRGFVLGILHSVLGRHWAVWISAIMFGLLHVGAPLSIPYLTLLGVYLGYARLYSGSLVLPVLLHFVHNLIVLLWK